MKKVYLRNISKNTINNNLTLVIAAKMEYRRLYPLRITWCDAVVLKTERGRLLPHAGNLQATDGKRAKTHLFTSNADQSQTPYASAEQNYQSRKTGAT